MRKITWLISLSLMLFRPASGQDQVPSGMHQDQLFPDFVEKMEGEFSLRFFYISRWVDSGQGYTVCSGGNPSTILEHSLSPHGLYFYQEDKQIFLSRNQAINPDILQSFKDSDSISRA